MNRMTVAFTLLLPLALAGCGGAPEEPQAERQPGREDSASPVSKMPAVGDPAPDFTLPDQDRNPVTLGDFRGTSNVVLAFYVLAFTGG